MAATSLIVSFRPVYFNAISVGNRDRARRFLKDAFDYLAAMGYALSMVTPKGLETYRTWDAELETFREGNYLAVPPERLKDLPTIPWWNA